jgi:23S rRNA pseudouridine1911/1915/1917 synthase
MSQSQKPNHPAGETNEVEKKPELLPENIAQHIKIIFEDDHILCIDKPSGLNVHPDGKREEYTLCDWIVAHYPAVSEVGEPLVIDGETISRPGIVHRLDKETSGIMLIAKDQNTYLYLKRQFSDRLVKKTYRAIMWGNYSEPRGTIQEKIGRLRSDVRKWAIEREARGEIREARTDFRVIGRCIRGSQKTEGMSETTKSNSFTYVEVFPQTGRTHQIRVHLKSIHHPIVGDMLYGPKKFMALGLKRLALHALAVDFKHPTTGRGIRLVAPLPKDIQDCEKFFE